VQVGVADLGQQRFETLAGCGQRRLVLAHDLYGSHRRRPQQLGLGVGFHRVGGGQLVDPAARLTQVVPQPPEQPQDPEQMRQRPAVMAQVPVHRGGQIGASASSPPAA